MAKIHFLNVEEGDCSIIQQNNGHVTMIDICYGNVDTKEMKPQLYPLSESLKGINGNFNQKSYPTNPIEYLKEHQIKSIFRYIQTHPDMDHMDGLYNLVNTVPIQNFWDTANLKKQEFDANGKCGKYLKKDWDCYCALRNSQSDPKALIYYDGTANKYFAEDDTGPLQDDYLKILSPTKSLMDTANEAGDWNDASYVILYIIQGRKILFCGDADTKTIEHLTKNHKEDISALDVLIAPHHGRDSNKDFSFLDIMRPKLTLIGNAKSEYLAYLEWNSRKLEHIQNNQGGNILIDVHDGELHVSCTNKTYADAYNRETFHNKGASKDINNLGYWNLFYYKAK